MTCMWFGEDQRANIIQNMCLKDIRLGRQILTTALHSIANAIGRSYV